MEETETVLLRTYLSCERDARQARFEASNAKTEEERRDALLRCYNSSYKSGEALYALERELGK